MSSVFSVFSVIQTKTVTITSHTPTSRVCPVFVTISATLEFFMLLIVVVGTLRVPSLQTKTVTITLHTLIPGGFDKYNLIVYNME